MLAYPAENQRSGWNIFHLSGGCPHCLQPLLCRRRSVRRREARIAQGAVADLVEARIRGTDTCGRGGLVECREPLPLEAPHRPLHRPLVRYLLRVRRNGLPPSVGKKARPGKGFRY